MAVDTALKRFSMMDFDVPSSPAMGPPLGSSTYEDRVHGLWLYGGIEPSGEVTDPSVFYDYIVRARRRGRR